MLENTNSRYSDDIVSSAITIQNTQTGQYSTDSYESFLLAGSKSHPLTRTRLCHYLAMQGQHTFEQMRYCLSK